MHVGLHACYNECCKLCCANASRHVLLSLKTIEEKAFIVCFVYLQCYATTTV